MQILHTCAHRHVAAVGHDAALPALVPCVRIKALLVQDLCLTLLFAGHDTSAHTIVRLFSELPRHPAVWERMAAEQQQVHLLASLQRKPMFLLTCVATTLSVRAANAAYVGRTGMCGFIEASLVAWMACHAFPCKVPA